MLIHLISFRLVDITLKKMRLGKIPDIIIRIIQIELK